MSSEINDEQQINWCIKNCCKNNDNDQLEEKMENPALPLNNLLCELSEVVSIVPRINIGKLKEKLLRKCECKRNENRQTDQYVLIQHVINAFCHPEVVSKVKDILMEQVRPNN